MSEARPTRPAGWHGLHKVAIVGASTLKGKELKETLEDRNFPSSEVVLLDDDEAQGTLDAIGDEVTFIHAVARDSFDDVDLVFFASNEDFTLKTWKLAQKAGAAIVDLSYALEAERTLRVRSPWLDRELRPEAAVPVAGLGVGVGVDLEATAVVAAHPAATMLALLITRLTRAVTLRAASAIVFDPVSEQGKRGMDELHQQTLNLLSFQSMPKEIYDMQVAFNMLSRYGEEAKASLEQVTDRIARHFTHITRGKAALPALQVLQAPTFHAHALSLYFEVEPGPDTKTAVPVTVQSLQEALTGDHVTVVAPDEDGPSNVTAAGQEEVLVTLRADRNGHGFWLWAAGDNLKISAITALECALALAAGRPSGKIQ